MHDYFIAAMRLFQRKLLVSDYYLSKDIDVYKTEVFYAKIQHKCKNNIFDTFRFKERMV